MDQSSFANNQTIQASSTPIAAQAASWVSAEEHKSVLEKMINTLKQPVGSLPREQSLYLEQQISDLLGFEVASELDQIHLPHTFGILAALPHLRRHPQDQITDHPTMQEAGLAPHRSSFGWFTEMGQLTQLAIEREKYFVSIQVDLLPEWRTSAQKLTEWYKYRKVVVINPVHELAVVACVGDFGPGNWIQHQFGASPEIVRHLGAWDLESQGKMFVFLVNDPTNKIALGPVKMGINL